MVRIGLIGHGSLAQKHAQRCAELPRANVVAVAGSDSPDGDTLADAATYDEPEEMFDDTTLDAVDVCSSTGRRRAVTAAADRDLHVLCPGALADSPADGAAIVDAVTTAGVVFVGGHATPFAPEYDAATRRVENGNIGAVGNARTSRHVGEEQAVGLFDLVGRDVEFLRRVCGDVDRVFARTTESDRDARALITVRFEDDVVGHVDVRQTVTEERRPVRRFELAGTNGLIEFDSEEATPVTISRTDRDDRSVPLRRDEHYCQIEHFLDCLAGGEQESGHAADALATLRACVAARASAERGNPVDPMEVGA
ncbi:hypothetical protein DMJ13_19300 [halophilic archaeon]|nr:hypothetical protein DMJ13_19300 [halophilic archaeon]